MSETFARLMAGVGAVALILSTASAVQATETCSEGTRAGLAPFVGEWSFASEHDGVIGGPPTVAIGTLTISECGFVDGLQIAAILEPHLEVESLISGRLLPFEEHIIRGDLTIAVDRIVEGPELPLGSPPPPDLVAEYVCVGMLQVEGEFQEARCIETEHEVESGVAAENLLVEGVMKRTR